MNNVTYEFTYRRARTYVGKTTQCLTERIKQHVPSGLLEKTKVKKCAADSAITKHLKDNPGCVHTNIRDNFTVLAKGRHQEHLNVLEAIFIRQRRPQLCLQKDHAHTLTLI